jgi:hypothetical protein
VRYGFKFSHVDTTCYIGVKISYQHQEEFLPSLETNYSGEVAGISSNQQISRELP